MEKSHINMQDVCLTYKVERQFLQILAENGLIEILWKQDQAYIYTDSLASIEKFATWYYDLDLNLQGIEVAHHLLQTIEKLQRELLALRNQGSR